MEWQPIEAAPKDGTNIMVWAKGYEWPEIVRYEEFPPIVADDAGAPGYWRYSDDVFADIAGFDVEEVSHWMPLPDRPI